MNLKLVKIICHRDQIIIGYFLIIIQEAYSHYSLTIYIVIMFLVALILQADIYLWVFICKSFPKI